MVFDVGLLSDCYTDYSASKTWLQAIVLMSKFCQTVVVFRAPKTWLQARRLMSGYCWTIIQSDSELFTGNTSKNYHLSGIYFPALIRNKLSYWIPCTMGARTEGGGGGGEGGRQLYNLHAPKTWLKARVLCQATMGIWTASMQPIDLTLSQGFWCQATVW